MTKINEKETFDEFVQTLCSVASDEHLEVARPYFEFMYKLRNRVQSEEILKCWMYEKFGFTSNNPDTIMTYTLASDPTKFRKTEMRVVVEIQKDKAIVTGLIYTYNTTFFSKQTRCYTDAIDTKKMSKSFSLDITKPYYETCTLIASRIDDYLTKTEKLAKEGSKYVNGK